MVSRHHARGPVGVFDPSEWSLPMNRELICNGAFLTVALSLAMAFLTKKSEAQPLGPTPAQMQFQKQVPGYEKAQVRRGPHRGPSWRRGRRWGFSPRRPRGGPWL